MDDQQFAPGQEGAASVFVLGLTVMLLAMAGLVIDGGNAINARQSLADAVEQAARAGATAVSEEGSREEDGNGFNQLKAQQRAKDFLSDQGYDLAGVSFPSSLPQTNGKFSIRVESTVQTKILLLVGRSEFKISAETTTDAISEKRKDIP